MNLRKCQNAKVLTELEILCRTSISNLFVFWISDKSKSPKFLYDFTGFNAAIGITISFVNHSGKNNVSSLHLNLAK